MTLSRNHALKTTGCALNTVIIQRETCCSIQRSLLLLVATRIHCYTLQAFGALAARHKPSINSTLPVGRKTQFGITLAPPVSDPWLANMSLLTEMKIV